MKQHTARAAKEDLRFGLPPSSPFIDAAWYSKVSKWGAARFSSEAVPKRRKFGIVKIAMLGWLAGLSGILVPGIYLSKHSSQPALQQSAESIVPLPEHRAVALRR